LAQAITRQHIHFLLYHLHGTMLDYAGYILAIVAAYKICSFTYRHFIRTGKNLAKEYGEWAVVTGATDGIGKEIARRLVEVNRMKVLIVGRNMTKLETVQKEIGAHEVLQINFSADWKSDVVTAATKDKDIGVLINNAGLSYEFPQYFNEVEESSLREMNMVNCESVRRMTYAVLPQLLQKKKGCIVNVSSLTAKCPAGMLTEYAATKAYLIEFSRALHCETRNQGVDVQVQIPGFVATKMSKIRNPTLTSPSPRAYAKRAVECIGHDREIAPYWAHDIMLGLSYVVPTRVQEFCLMSMHKPLRLRALKKRAAAETKAQ